MGEPRRFNFYRDCLSDCYCEAEETVDGDYVSYEDCYQPLHAETERLRGDIKDLTNQLERLRKVEKAFVPLYHAANKIILEGGDGDAVELHCQSAHYQAITDACFIVDDGVYLQDMAALPQENKA